MTAWWQDIAAWLGRSAGGAKNTAKKPFEDLQPTVEWQVAGRCNYDCTYCIQSPAKRVGAPEEQVSRGIVKGLAGLPGVWEIKISGGEPFAYAGFLRWVVPDLIALTPHHISVLTNFSAPLPILEKFCELTGERLRITSASLHLEHIEVQAYLDKALAYRELRARYNPHSSFVVNCVLVPGKLDALFAVRDAVQAEGLRFFPQWMKVGAGIYPYTARDLSLIRELTGDARSPAEVNRSPSYRGARCEAGAWYFVVDQTGEAWSCRTAKRTAEPGDTAHLGNLADGTFKRWAEGGPCPFDICPCTVPANRGIVRHPDALRSGGQEVGDGF